MTDDANRRVLWGIGTPRTMRAHWTLHELSLPYEARAVRTRSAPTQTPEFAKLNPRRKIPVLQDGDFTITESAAIAMYLADRYGSAERALSPCCDADRPRLLEWCFFVMTELDATTMYVIRRHQGLKEIYGDAPAAVQSAKSYYLKQVGCVGEVLSRQPYLMGEKFGVGDILLTTCLTGMIDNGVGCPEPCAAYLDRTTARPAYRAAYAINFPDI